MTRIGFAYNLKPESPASGGSNPQETQQVEGPPNRWRNGGASRVSEIAARTAPAPVAPTTDVPEDLFAEWDTPETVAAVANALAALGDVIPLEATPDFPERLRAARPDIVFNIAEGWFGANREAHVPAICEFLGIPYSGSDPFTLSLCLHKARAKEILAFHGVETAPFALVNSIGELPALRRRLRQSRRPNDAASPFQHQPLRLPVFVKPVHEGSSKGITERSYCETTEALEAQIQLLLERYEQPVLVEQYLTGAEFTCAVLGNGAGATVLPLVAIRFGALPEGALPVFGFEAKWLWDQPDNPLDIFECPAKIDRALRRKIERLVLRTYQCLGCRDWARIDVRLDSAGIPNVVEVNPLPGILPDPAENSCLPMAARAAGFSYDALIQRCAGLAAERYGIALPRPAELSGDAVALRAS